MGKGVVVVVVVVVFVVKVYWSIYFGTRETGFAHFVFGTTSDWALVFDLETFQCFGLKIKKFYIRFGKTRWGGLLYLTSRNFNVLALKRKSLNPFW